MVIDLKELELIKQWFDSVMDINPEYLTTKDYLLIRKIYLRLGYRIPKKLN